MKPMRIFTSIFVLALTALGVGPSPSQAGADMLKRMMLLNPHLHSYQASIHVDIALHTFPYLSPSLDGTYYHKEPSKDKIAFDTVPAVARQFNKVYPRIESPSRWKAIFYVSYQGDNGGQTTFKLVPRVRGRIDHITVKVDDATATIVQETWNYNDGGYAQINQKFTTVNGNYIASMQTGHLDVPHYVADMNSSFSNFKLNPPLSDAVFKE